MTRQSQRRYQVWLPLPLLVRAAGPSGAGNRAECAVAPVGPTPAARTTTNANETARQHG